VRNEIDQIMWLQHVLSDPDNGHFYTFEQLTAMEEELKDLQKNDDS